MYYLSLPGYDRCCQTNFVSPFSSLPLPSAPVAVVKFFLLAACNMSSNINARFADMKYVLDFFEDSNVTI